MKELVPQETIESKILFLRGKKVLLDRDLAVLYGVETRVLNQAVRRNIDRFPEDFMFSLTRPEIMNLSQTVISSTIKHAPNVFAFTEQDVAMLSSVLNSQRAVQVNIQIMLTFVKIRRIIVTNIELKRRIEAIDGRLDTHDKHFRAVFDAIKNLLTPQQEEKPKRKMGFTL